MTNVVIGCVYRHYKGNLYKVVGKAVHTETGEELVIYQAMYGDMKVWARPKEMFCETVELDGKIIPRFSRVKDKTVEPIKKKKKGYYGKEGNNKI